jgi:hypothetical protein
VMSRTPRNEELNSAYGYIIHNVQYLRKILRDCITFRSNRSNASAGVCTMCYQIVVGIDPDELFYQCAQCRELFCRAHLRLPSEWADTNTNTRTKVVQLPLRGLNLGNRNNNIMIRQADGYASICSNTNCSRLICSNCQTMQCPGCNKLFCSKCCGVPNMCVCCELFGCARCYGHACVTCQKSLCKKHSYECAKCGEKICVKCLVRCVCCHKVHCQKDTVYWNGRWYCRVCQKERLKKWLTI